jgi:hypothetical protein
MLRVLKIFTISAFAIGLLVGVYFIPADQVNSETGDSPLYAASLDNTTNHISGKDNGRTSDGKGGGVGDLITCEVTCGPTCNQTTCGVTCVQTCEFTCTNTCNQVTCEATCVATCEATCANTCEQPTCESTCVVTCSYTCEEPITLASFTAHAEADHVVVNWATGSEVETYCFRIYRSASQNGEFTLIEDYIPATGGSVTTEYTYVDNSVEVGQSYFYQLADINKYGWETRHSTIASAIAGQIGVVGDFSLAQNYPNPFNPETTIRYSVPTAGQVELAVYDLTGRKVATLVNGYQSAGIHDISWDASPFAAGVYVYTLTANGQTATGKMIYMK